MYKVKAGTDAIVFYIKDSRLAIKSYQTDENLFDESEILSDKARIQNGTNVEIPDERFGICNEFPRYGYTTFERFKDSNQDDDSRCILAINSFDIEYV